MHKLKNLLNRVLGTVCVVIFALMTIVGLYQIITRYFFNAPSTISEELLTFLFTWLALLAASLVFGMRDHMRMSFVADKFEGKAGNTLEIISELLVIVFSVFVLIYGGFDITKLTMAQTTASLGIPMGYVYMVVPISGVLTVIYSIINLSELFAGRKEEKA